MKKRFWITLWLSSGFFTGLLIGGGILFFAAGNSLFPKIRDTFLSVLSKEESLKQPSHDIVQGDSFSDRSLHCAPATVRMTEVSHSEDSVEEVHSSDNPLFQNGESCEEVPPSISVPPPAALRLIPETTDLFSEESSGVFSEPLSESSVADSSSIEEFPSGSIFSSEGAPESEMDLNLSTDFVSESGAPIPSENDPEVIEEEPPIEDSALFVLEESFVSHFFSELSPSQWSAFLISLADNPSLRDYAVSLKRAAQSATRLNLIGEWNQFVQGPGSELGVFSVTSETATVGIRFYQEYRSTLSFLPEWKNLEERIPELTVAARAVPIQSRILARLLPPMENALVYQPNPDLYYYLNRSPQLGENRYRSNYFGETRSLSLDSTALTQVYETTWSLSFARWREAAQAIPDSLRKSSPSTWYQRWSALLEDILHSQEDPLLVFFLLKDITTILSEGDWYFDLRLGVWRNYFQNERIPDGVDFFDAENPRTRTARAAAREFFPFLPLEILAVDKTDEQLDLLTPKLTSTYRMIAVSLPDGRLIFNDSVENLSGEVVYFEGDSLCQRSLGTLESIRNLPRILSNAIDPGTILFLIEDKNGVGN